MDELALTNAWDILTRSQLNLSEKMYIRKVYTSTYRHEFPFIAKETSGEGSFYRSELKEISAYIFDTETEVNLANSIVLALQTKFDSDEFRFQFKSILRVLGIKSSWA